MKIAWLVTQDGPRRLGAEELAGGRDGGGQGFHRAMAPSQAGMVETATKAFARKPMGTPGSGPARNRTRKALTRFTVSLREIRRLPCGDRVLRDRIPLVTGNGAGIWGVLLLAWSLMTAAWLAWLAARIAAALAGHRV